MIGSAALTGSSLFILGPSELLHLPDSLFLMGGGQALLGIFSVFLYVPSLPEMLESTKPLYAKQS